MTKREKVVILIAKVLKEQYIMSDYGYCLVDAEAIVKELEQKGYFIV